MLIESTRPFAWRDEVHSEPQVPIDMAHLGRYTLGDASLEREVLGLFLGQIPLTIEALRYAVSDKDWYQAAHTLKGSARAVGAWRVASLAQQAEKSGAIGDPDQRQGLIARLEEAVAEAEAFVAKTFPLPAA